MIMLLKVMNICSVVMVNLPTMANFWMRAINPNTFEIDVMEGGWRWLDRTPFNYLNWNSGKSIICTWSVIK